MDVDPAPVVRDKKRFEVKKVSAEGSLMACGMAYSFFAVECSSFMGLG